MEESRDVVVLVFGPGVEVLHVQERSIPSMSSPIVIDRIDADIL